MSRFDSWDDGPPGAENDYLPQRSRPPLKKSEDKRYTPNSDSRYESQSIARRRRSRSRSADRPKKDERSHARKKRRSSSSGRRKKYSSSSSSDSSSSSGSSSSSSDSDSSDSSSSKSSSRSSSKRSVEKNTQPPKDEVPEKSCSGEEDEAKTLPPIEVEDDSKSNEEAEVQYKWPLPCYPPAPEPQLAAGTPFRNDGSFLEMFKKMQEQEQTTVKPAAPGPSATIDPHLKKPTLPFVGKRRGGRLLKTGLVKKPKAIDEQHVTDAPKDAWSLYMQEVKKYRETSCEEEGKTRPLVK